MAIDQRPVELILARALMSNLTTPAFLVDEDGTLVFFNDAAGELLGLVYEDAGSMSMSEWGTRFVPLDADGRQIPVDDLPLAVVLRDERPVYSRFTVCSLNGDEREIQVSAFPIVGNEGLRGGMAIFWEGSET